MGRRQVAQRPGPHAAPPVEASARVNWTTSTPFWVAALGVAALAFGCHSNALSGDWAVDDPKAFLWNPDVVGVNGSMGPFSDLLHHDYWGEDIRELDVNLTCYTCGGIRHPQRMCPSRTEGGKGK